MNKHVASENVMDRWIESFTNSLVAFVRKEMDSYKLYAVVGPLTKFFDTLTNIYIRLNRKRVKGDSGLHDQEHALAALGRVLILIVRLMAPFTPFFCEHIWANLKKVIGSSEESVHFLMLPKPDESLIDESVERRVEVMRNVIDLVRLVRDREGIAVKYPLKEMIVINRDNQFLEDVKSLEQYVLLELNVRKLTVSQDKEKYGITLKAEPNFKLLGARLKGEQKKVADYLKNKITEAELEKFLLEGKLTVLGHELTSEEVSVSYANGADQGHGYKTHSDAKTIVMVDTTEDESLVEEGLCREVTNRVQRLRKQGKLVSTDSAQVYLVVHPATSQLAQVVAAKLKDIESATGTPIKLGVPPAGGKTPTTTSKSAVKDAEVELWLLTDGVGFEGITVVDGSKKVQVHVKTENQKLRGYADLLYHVRSALDLWGGKVALKNADGTLVHPTVEVDSLAGQTLHLVK
uniref:Anticodon_1 domain-containing protein n=1 Tax=Caenorhabditis japonica TaxID=281687 RepID=A0A8R1E1M7_CAEJA